MDEGTGRGHRQKIPTDKVRDLGPGGRVEKVEEERQVLIPTYIAPNDPKFLVDPPELGKLYDHSKVGRNGQKTEFFQLGTHIESKEKRFYMRAKRDPESLYFHTAQASPHYARWSDENHPQCAVEGLKNCFTKDMLGKTGEMGSYTTRANVFAREGQFFFEAKILSQAPPGRERPDTALADSQHQERSSINRGGIRVGFCRREHHWSETMGGNAYSYAVVCRCGTGREYGNVRFNTTMHHLSGQGAQDPGDLVPGDVVGLMITLPPLEVQQKVVEGTFNPSDYPDLKCGPANIKARKGTGTKKTAKPAQKSKDRETESGRPKDDVGRKSGLRTELRAPLKAVSGLIIPPHIDIIRDRNPFLFKGLAYYECPDYTPHPDLSRPTLNAKSKSVNAETGKKYDLTSDPHPNHELTHLRTIPGSKIELWVNGRYHGVVWEHLFSFLPPASSIEKSSRTSVINGDIDDGLLGYYPAISHYTGGAVECNFDGPWWCGYQDGPERPQCRPIGERYNEQIVEDCVSDLVDEIYQEQMWQDPDWMRKRIHSGLPNGTTVGAQML
jgi:COMPASS component BRE2